MTYKLHCFAQSGHSYKAALMLNLVGAEWEPVFVDFFNGAARTPEFKAINEMGECPVFEGDGKTLTQSGVILDYLARKFDKYGPSTEDDHLEILRWTIWENQKLNGFMGPYRFMLNWAPAKIRNEGVDAFLKGRTLASLDVLNTHLTGKDWVACGRPTTADVACAAYIYYPDEEYGIAIGEDYPAIDAWRNRLKELDGWKHPYDLMPGHPMPAKEA